MVDIDSDLLAYSVFRSLLDKPFLLLLLVEPLIEFFFAMYELLQGG